MPKARHAQLLVLGASLEAQSVKSLPAMWETWVQSLGWEDPLEKEMTTHSSIFAWRIPWTEEVGDYSSWGHKESDTTERLTVTLSQSIGRQFSIGLLNLCMSILQSPWMPLFWINLPWMFS